MNTDFAREAGMNDYEGTPSGVLIRDFLIFQFKTVLDGMKDAIVIPFSIIALIADLMGSPSRRGRTFYALLGACEAFDRWLNLHAPARNAARGRDGLFDTSEPGDGTMVGELEEILRGERAPVLPRA
jgi:hypothetical protein